MSLGLPVYNGAPFIESCLRSICEQTFEDFELIVCDNASTDETPEIVEHWCAGDARIKLLRSPENRGAATNFNWAFGHGRGEFFKWCAADDLLDPTFLQVCVSALDDNPGAVLAYSGALDIDDSGSVLGEIYDNSVPLNFGDPDPAERFLNLITQGHSCISVFGVIRADAMRSTSLIGPYAASDKVFLAELGVQGRFVRVDGDLLLHRQHAGRSVTEFRRLQERAAWFDPARRGRTYPHFRLIREYGRVALSRSLPLRAQLRCLLHVGRWFWWEGSSGMRDDVLYQFGALK